MAITITTNVASLNAQRNLDRSQSTLNVSLQRLSSGLRINSARDDAAGLAISERFTTQIRGLNQAARNASDGISLAQTAEGDLAQITNNLQRIRELAVQSANATNSASDRAALQLEANQLISEIDRVASTSAFNGVRLLNGNFSSQLFQVGANAGETVSISSIGNARTSALGQTNGATLTNTAAVTANFTNTDLTVNGSSITAAADARAIADAITAVDANLSATATNVQASITFADVVGTDLTSGAATAGTTTLAGALATSDFSVDSASFTVDGTTVTLNANYTNQAGVAAAIGTQLGASYSVSEQGGVVQIATTSTGTGAAAPVLAAFNGNVDGGDADSVVANFVTGTQTTNGTAASADVETAASAFTLANFSVTNLVFDVTDTAGTTTTVSLNTDYTSGGNTLANVVSDINTALTAGGTNVTVTSTGGNLVYTDSTTGSSSDLTVSYTSGGTLAEIEGALVQGANATSSIYTATLAATPVLDYSVDDVSFSVTGSGGTAAVVLNSTRGTA